jgi:hypothetical protein
MRHGGGVHAGRAAVCVWWWRGGAAAVRCSRPGGRDGAAKLAGRARENWRASARLRGGGEGHHKNITTTSSSRPPAAAGALLASCCQCRTCARACHRWLSDNNGRPADWGRGGHLPQARQQAGVWQRRRPFVCRSVCFGPASWPLACHTRRRRGETARERPSARGGVFRVARGPGAGALARRQSMAFKRAAGGGGSSETRPPPLAPPSAQEVGRRAPGGAVPLRECRSAHIRALRIHSNALHSHSHTHCRRTRTTSGPAGLEACAGCGRPRRRQRRAAVGNRRGGWT